MGHNGYYLAFWKSETGTRNNPGLWTGRETFGIRIDKQCNTEEWNQTLQILDSFCGQVNNPQSSIVYKHQNGERCSVCLQVDIAFIWRHRKKFHSRAHLGSRFVSPLPMSVVKLQAHGPSARSCTFPWYTQLGLLLTNLYRAFVSVTFLLSK